MAKREQKSYAAHKKSTSRLLRTSSNAHFLLEFSFPSAFPQQRRQPIFAIFIIYSTFLQYFIMLLVAIF
jgi:hypothetical protein